jgi:hypothetical protein
MKLLSTIVLALIVSISSAFVSNTRCATSTSVQAHESDEKNSKMDNVMSNNDEIDARSGPFGGFNPLNDIVEMFQNLDDGKLSRWLG